MPRKKAETTTTNKAFVMETTPPSLRHLGGDCLLLAGTPDHVNPADAVNASPTTIGRGDVVHKLAPEAPVQFTTIEDKPGIQVSLSTRAGGWQPVRANEWYFSERMQIVFTAMPDGRVACVDTTGTEAIYLYVRPEEFLRRDMAKNRQFTDDVSKSAEQRLADTGQRLAWAGLTPIMMDEVEDEEGRVLSRRETDFVTRGF